ncbi:MAG: hypothetical protein IJA69_00825 [Clostridia bacterium]|nr:hypothetical protein [Clostridia bacterium]
MKKNNKFMKSFVVLCAFMLAMLSTSMLFKEIAWNKGSLIAWTNYAEDPVFNELTGNYEIHTPEQLAGLAKKVNAGTTYEGETIVLCENIDLKGANHNSSGLNWTPIGIWDISSESAIYKTDKMFKGIFDGQGFLIANLNVNQVSVTSAGLFGAIAGSAVLKNVSLKGRVIHNKNTAGGLVGTTGYYSNITIENCIVEVEVTTTNLSGGVLGSSSSDNLYIANCLNYGNVYSYSDGSDAAGIIALPSLEVTNIYNCHNYGKICALASEYPSSHFSVGGIMGYFIGGESEIKNCSNEGDIVMGCDVVIDETKKLSDNYSSSMYVGGYGTKTCYLADRGNAGGIAGSADVIENCYVTDCTINVPSKNFLFDRGEYEFNISDVGGIVGNCEDIKNCYSTALFNTGCAGLRFNDVEEKYNKTLGDSGKNFLCELYTRWNTSSNSQVFSQGPIAGQHNSFSNNYYYGDFVPNIIDFQIRISTYDSRGAGVAYFTNKNNILTDSDSSPDWNSTRAWGAGTKYYEFSSEQTYDTYESATGGSGAGGGGGGARSATPVNGVYVEPYGGGGSDTVTVTEKLYRFYVKTTNNTNSVTFTIGIENKKYVEGAYSDTKTHDLITFEQSKTSLSIHGTQKSSISQIASELDSSVWATNANINGGKPYLKSQYWLEA